MIRIALALVIALALLVGVHAWSQWLMDTNEAARSFVLSRGFTLFAIVSGTMVAGISAVVMAALLFHADAPDHGK
jgi:TRAP-type C4-dicarboxylate transport system permease small subunit